MERKSTVERKTKETDITLSLDLDGKGLTNVNTGIPFFDHMLTLMAAHGLMDLEVSAKGDTEIDYHHTIEDIGICLGKAIKQALKEKQGIRRYGQATVPMDEALVNVIMDISNRPFLAYDVSTENSKAGKFDINLIEEFFRAVVNYAGITLHALLISGKDAHHVAESVFKAFGRALDQACSIDNRLGDSVPSTKGLL